MSTGNIAGKIWKTLDKNGAMTVNALAKELENKNNDILLGLGWLLREDKLEVSKSGNCIKYALKQEIHPRRGQEKICFLYDKCLTYRHGNLISKKSACRKDHSKTRGNVSRCPL